MTGRRGALATVLASQALRGLAYGLVCGGCSRPVRLPAQPTTTTGGTP